MLDVGKYIEQQLEGAEKTHVFIVVKNGVIIDTKTNNTRAVIHVIDLDDEPSIGQVSWPETQV